MLKRLIEVALPLKEVSEQSAREKSIRHGHISTLHIWWARRPLAACRAAVFASLIPDPDDPECPEQFRNLVMDVLGRAEFKPKVLEPLTTAPVPVEAIPLSDTPRHRCLEFIKHLVRWENSNNPEYIEPARTLIAAAHKILHPEADSDSPKVLDPFAGGGAIPLEALRLGCEAHAVELNPVAHLIELCTLVYPQKYGQPDTRPVPDYIKRLIERRRTEGGRRKKERSLFDDDSESSALNPPSSDLDDIIPDVEITESEYRKNPLAADVKYWGHWVLKKARREIGQFHPAEPDGPEAIGYLWTRTVKCPNPTCHATIPLLRQVSLCKQQSRNVELSLNLDETHRTCSFQIVESKKAEEGGSSPTMQRGDATCPFCNQIAPVKYLREECRKGRMGEQMTCVVTVASGRQGKTYRAVTKTDTDRHEAAQRLVGAWTAQYGDSILPHKWLTGHKTPPTPVGGSGPTADLTAAPTAPGTTETPDASRREPSFKQPNQPTWRPPFHAGNTEFAYQLHYHIGFQTRRRVPVFQETGRFETLRDILPVIAKRSDYHVLETEIEDCWIRLLVSLKPGDSPAKTVQTIKANSSRLLFEAFPEIEREIGRRSLWSRGYYVRGVGDVPSRVVLDYIASQKQHHEIDCGESVHLADYAHPNPKQFLDLRPFSHCMADYNCHFVCCPVGHVGAIDRKFAEPLIEYALCVAAKRKFEVIRLSVLSDHVHLFAALRPDQSPQDLAFAVMNNTSHWFRRQNPGVFKIWDIPGFWTCSAFLRTAGAVTTNQVRNYLRRRALG